MKVFLAGTSLQPSYGGPAFSVTRLADALADIGVDVGLWAPDQSARTTQLLRVGSSVRRLTGNETEALNTLGDVAVVHDNGLWRPHNHRLAKLAAQRGVPRVVSTRGMLEPWAMNHKRWKKEIAWRLYQRRDLTVARCLHATAQAEARNLERLRLDVPIRVIPNGVDVPDLDSSVVGNARREARADGRRTALFVGRIYPVKGLPMLIEAWARERPSGWQLQIAGPDEAGHRAEVERAARAAGLSDVVLFLGPVEGAAKASAFLEADLFVLPTYSESFGMAIGEALAYGLPVLTTTGAPWPMLTELGCGWWVTPTVDGIADGLRHATSCDRKTLQEMGRRGAAFITAEFGWEQVAKQFVAAYEDVTSS